MLDGENIGRGKALEGCTVKIVLQRAGKPDKTLAKTKSAKTKSPHDKAVWNEMFLITELTAADYIAIEVEDARTMSNKYLGAALLCQVQTIQPQDEVIDAYYTLQSKLGGAPDAPDDDDDGGNGSGSGSADKAPRVHLRLYYSNVPQSRAKMPRPESMKYALCPLLPLPSYSSWFFLSYPLSLPMSLVIWTPVAS